MKVRRWGTCVRVVLRPGRVRSACLLLGRGTLLVGRIVWSVGLCNKDGVNHPLRVRRTQVAIDLVQEPADAAPRRVRGGPHADLLVRLVLPLGLLHHDQLAVEPVLAPFH